MKNLYQLTIISLLLAACSQKGNGPLEPNANEIVLSGKIENAAGNDGDMILEIVQEDRNNPFAPVDTIEVSDDYTFSESVIVPEPGYYRLNLYGRQFVNLILSDDNVMINADLAKGPGTAIIEGSKDTDLMESVNQIVRKRQQEIAKLEQEFIEARGEGNTSRMEALTQQYQKVERYKREDIKRLLRNAPSSVAAIYAVNYLNKEEDFGFLDTLATRLKQDIPNSKYITDFAQGVEKMRSTTVGETAPEIALPNPEGETKRLSDLRGKIVLVDFWAAWCGPCRRENPNVVKVYNKYKDQGFEVFGVSLDKEKTAWVKAIAQDNLNWTQVSDLKYFNSEAAQTYGINSIPATVLLDREGKIIARNLRGPALEEKLEEIFSN
jgi:peroxiredoxin